MSSDQRACLLMVDDDPEDILLVKIAAKRAAIPLDVCSLADGRALMEHLASLDRTHVIDGIAPDLLVFLDLNMPRKDGRCCLREIKSNPRYRDIPVIVYSTSDSPEDIQRSYELDANSYICKPGDLGELETMLATIYQYWFRKPGHSARDLSYE